MALDKLVDSSQLDSDLTGLANAIRTKGGTSAQLAFPAGFVIAVQNIPSGGVTPTGTKQISITQNGTTTEDVTNYANAEITVNVSGGGGAYSISAVFTQGENKIFTTDELDDLKQYLVVTVTYSDQSTEVLPDDAYTLSGTLTAGTSTITVTALKQTATFSVTVISATDVTPNIANMTGAKATVSWNAETGVWKGYTTAAQQWAQGQMSGYTVSSGYRYRITADAVVADPQTKARISFMNPSTYNLMAVTNTLQASGKLLYDGVPSESANYAQNATLNFYITGSPASTGSVILLNIKIIKYAA